VAKEGAKQNVLCSSVFTPFSTMTTFLGSYAKELEAWEANPQVAIDSLPRDHQDKAQPVDWNADKE
jgi:hypothetical protein